MFLVVANCRLIHLAAFALACHWLRGVICDAIIDYLVIVVVQITMTESKGQLAKAESEPRDFEWESKTLSDLFDLYFHDPKVGVFGSNLLLTQLSQELPPFYEEFVRQYDRVPDGKNEEEYYANVRHPHQLLMKVFTDLVSFGSLLSQSGSFALKCMQTFIL